MPRRNHIPTYRLHKQSGQAIVTLTDGAGGRHDVLLGEYGTPESRSEYLRVLAEWEANGRRPAAPGSGAGLTVNELILAFWPHAEQHYRHPDGTPTSELDEYRLSLRPLKELYGHTPAKDFGPLALKAVRQKMLDQDITRRIKDPATGKLTTVVVGRGLARGVTNQRIGRIKRLFKWAVENELVGPSVHHALQAVRGLQRGRTAARETEPVRPVPEAFVDAVLAVVLPPVAAMIRLQLLTGMRPGEVTAMRGCDLDMAGPIWSYVPARHKTEHHGHCRVICIGPKAQAVLKPWLKLDTQAYLFSPNEALEVYRAEQRRTRKTKVQPSQMHRRKRPPRKAPGDHYTVSGYGHAIANACRKADRLAHQENPTIPADQVIIPSWHPHQLRHNAATRLRREYGLDVARVVLGHRSPQITEVYAELDTTKAADVMGKIG